MISRQGRMWTSRLREMKSAESDVDYFKVNWVFNGEPVNLLEKSESII